MTESCATWIVPEQDAQQEAKGSRSGATINEPPHGLSASAPGHNLRSGDDDGIVVEGLSIVSGVGEPWRRSEGFDIVAVEVYGVSDRPMPGARRRSRESE